MSPKFGFTMLGSGSHGNASVVHGPEGNLLLDAGVRAVEIPRRMKDVGVDPASIRAIIVSHAHVDHTAGCAVFSKRDNIPVYLMPKTAMIMNRRKEMPENVKLFAPDSTFELCGIQIQSFTVSHDTPTSGFAFSACGRKIGVATDLGFVSDSVREHLNGCDLLVLESNYDIYKLRTSKRSIYLKRRNAGKFGHLGNTGAMDALGCLLAENTKHLIFAHISQECNDYKLVSKLAEARLAELNRQDVAFRIATQDTPFETICLEEPKLPLCQSADAICVE